MRQIKLLGNRLAETLGRALLGSWCNFTAAANCSASGYSNECPYKLVFYNEY